MVSFYEGRDSMTFYFTVDGKRVFATDLEMVHLGPIQVGS